MKMIARENGKGVAKSGERIILTTALVLTILTTSAAFRAPTGNLSGQNSTPGESAAAPSDIPVATTFDMLSIDSSLGEICDTPAALAVLKQYAPELVTIQELRRSARLVSPRFLRVELVSLTPQKLALLNSKLQMIEAPPVNMRGPQSDPTFVPQKLKLTQLPKGTGKPQQLFNGRDLNGWDIYLGPVERRPGTNESIGQPVGLNNDPTHIFSIQTVDGNPAIRCDGRIWGTLTTKGDYGSYHLRLEYKWGDKRWPADNPPPRNNGVLYHSYGDYGALGQTWMYSIELEMIPDGKVAGANPVGEFSWFKTSVGRDMSLAPPDRRRFLPGGREIVVGAEGWEFIEGNSNPERPIGQWNAIDLYVVGDQAIHVLNGVPMIAIHDMTRGKDHTPLTHGRIQLQSEGAETFFRNITLQPIEKLPTIVSTLE